MEERLRSLGEYGEGSRQFNVQIFPLLPSLHSKTSSRRPWGIFSVPPSTLPYAYCFLVLMMFSTPSRFSPCSSMASALHSRRALSWHVKKKQNLVFFRMLITCQILLSLKIHDQQSFMNFDFSHGLSKNTRIKRHWELWWLKFLRFHRIALS